MGLDTSTNSGYLRTSFSWYYAFDFSVFTAITSGLVDGTIDSGNFAITDFFTSYSDYIVKAQIYPFSLDNFFTLTAQSPIALGKTTINYSGYYLTISGSGSGAPIKKWFEFSLSRYYNIFLDFEPYTVIKLYVPFFDIVDLPLEKCYGFTIEGYLSIDVNTGKATLWLCRKSDGVLIHSQSKKISVDLPLGKSNAEEKQRNNILQSISALGSAVGLGVGLTTGNPLITAGSVGLLTKNITQAMSNNVDRMKSYSGGGEGLDSWVCDKGIYLITSRPQHVTKPDVSLVGNVLNETEVLDDISGFTKISDINFNPMNEVIYDDEISEIIDLLKSGVIL